MERGPHGPDEHTEPEVLRVFTRLLDEERQAAVRADVQALVSLQEAKREALERLGALGLPADASAELARRARHNVALMRHMLDCMRGLVGLEDERGTYAQDGSIKARPGRALGAL